MVADVVIIGAGIAGVQAATTLSSLGKKTILITNEMYEPYYRMRLCEIVSGGEPLSIAIHPYSWYEDKGISLVYGNVVAIDKNKHILKLEDGNDISYSTLIVASGANAFSFPVKGAEGKIHVLRSMDDALSLRSKLPKIKSLAIIGGGTLGIEAAWVIKDSLDISVNVIEGNYILSKMIDKDSVKILKEHLCSKGIKIFENEKAEEYKDGALVLQSGARVDADLILEAIGVRPCVSFLQEKTANSSAIIVDDSLRTSDKDIFAIGDAIEFDGMRFSLAMYAREQGIFVANEIASGIGKYIPSEIFSSLKIGGIDISFLGKMEGESKVIENGNSRIVAFVSDGVVNGISLINAKAFISRAREAIGKTFNVKDFE